MAGSEMPTQPGWTPSPSRRRGPSDRLLIALIGAFVALAESWRALVPSAQAAPDIEVNRRIEKLEAAQGKVEGWIGDLRVDMADVKARLPHK